MGEEIGSDLSPEQKGWSNVFLSLIVTKYYSWTTML